MKARPLLFLALLASAWPAGAAVTLPATETRMVSFGEPVAVKTAILRATGIVLNADERLRSVSQADGERWLVDWSEYGPDGATVPVLTVTPTDCGLTTNLLVLTTRRVYSILLTSPPCDPASRNYDPDAAFDSLVRFRYPDSELTKDAPASPLREGPAPLRFTAPIEELVEASTRFTWKARHGYRGPTPRLVTTDGTTTYLVFSAASFRGQDLPLFFLVNDRGERELANFDVEGGTFLVRTTFEKAVLVSGDARGRRQPHLEIRQAKAGAR